MKGQNDSWQLVEPEIGVKKGCDGQHSNYSSSFCVGIAEESEIGVWHFAEATLRSNSQPELGAACKLWSQSWAGAQGWHGCCNGWASSSLTPGANCTESSTEKCTMTALYELLFILVDMVRPNALISQEISGGGPPEAPLSAVSRSQGPPQV